MYELFNSLGTKIREIILAFGVFFQKLIIEDTTIGQFIADVLPSEISWVGNIVAFVLNFTLFDFIFLAVEIWLAIVIIKFVADLFT